MKNLPGLDFVEWESDCADSLECDTYKAEIHKAQILALLEKYGSTDELLACIQKLDENSAYALIIDVMW